MMNKYIPVCLLASVCFCSSASAKEKQYQVEVTQQSEYEPGQSYPLSEKEVTFIPVKKLVMGCYLHRSESHREAVCMLLAPEYLHENDFRIIVSVPEHEPVSVTFRASNNAFLRVKVFPYQGEAV